MRSSFFGEVDILIRLMVILRNSHSEKLPCYLKYFIFKGGVDVGSNHCL